MNEAAEDQGWRRDKRSNVVFLSTRKPKESDEELEARRVELALPEPDELPDKAIVDAILEEAWSKIGGRRHA